MTFRNGAEIEVPEGCEAGASNLMARLDGRWVPDKEYAEWVESTYNALYPSGPKVCVLCAAWQFTVTLDRVVDLMKYEATAVAEAEFVDSVIAGIYKMRPHWDWVKEREAEREAKGNAETHRPK